MLACPHFFFAMNLGDDRLAASSSEDEAGGGGGDDGGRALASALRRHAT